MQRIAMTLLFVAVLLAAAPLSAQNPNPGSSLDNDEARRTLEYWTPARMAAARPMPTPTMVVDVDANSSQDFESSERGRPGYAPGWYPESGRAQPSADAAFSIRPGDALWQMAVGGAPQHGAPGTNPKTGPYPPFQRWTVMDSVNIYPKRTIGTFFFTLLGGGFRCSASLIQKRTVITAGHCVSDGAGSFISSATFCPAYRGGAPNPLFGCFPVTFVGTSGRWHSFGDPDYDHGCAVLSTRGTVLTGKAGSFLGWLGRAWNFKPKQQEQALGYPAAPPFNGKTLQMASSAEWYALHFFGGGQMSKFMGSDLTGGSSGGPWVLGWNHATKERSDSDGSKKTDPGSNWVNGVNSHKRCTKNCRTPPTNSKGVHWQEMSSPEFRRGASDPHDSEDVNALCFNAGGT